MRSIVGVLLVTTAFFGWLPACSSSKNGNGGGGCSDFRGTYQGQLICTGLSDQVTEVSVTQTGCSVTVTDQLSGEITSWTGSGNKATQAPMTGSTQTCSVTLNGNAYTQSCSIMVQGQTISCTGSGTRTPLADAGPLSTGAGGSLGTGGGTGVGVGGSTGTGGAMPPGQCGNIPWTNDATCESCMTTRCCTELRNCSAGTPCGNLLQCAATKCPTFDANCIESMCSAELGAGASGLTDLANCNQDNCNSCT